MKKWEIANNRTQKNKDVVNVLPFIKVWYSKNYFFETGVFTPAFGIAISWLKWNDRNGVYYDEESMLEFGNILTHKEAMDIMISQIMENR